MVLYLYNRVNVRKRETETERGGVEEEVPEFNKSGVTTST